LVVDETLAWTRPNFLELQFELVSSTAVVARVGIKGIGPERHVLAESDVGTWRIDLFPMDRKDVPITSVDGGDPVAIYWRGNPVEVRFFDGQTYRFRTESAAKTMIEDSSGTLVFSIEIVESFPRWRVEMKLETNVLEAPKVAILLASACCYLVFTNTNRIAASIAEQSSVQGGQSS
jgi:hypothetical protein